jgi:DNA-directed RNA polymerase subunit F
MIKNREPLSMQEAMKYIDKEKRPEVIAFTKQFSKLSPEKAEELRKKLNDLNLIKLNKSNISKLIEILPEDKGGFTKVLPESNIDENVTNIILETIKEHK